jgi:PAS domain S-box-containing protein
VTPESDFFDGTGRRVLRARAWILRILLTLVAVGWLGSTDIRLMVLFAVIGFSLWVPPMLETEQRVLSAIFLDSALAITAWWLYGPASGPDVILVILAAIAGLVLTGSDRTKAAMMIVIAEVIQIPLHLWAEGLDRPPPLFHSTVQVIEDGEFIVGVLARAVALILAFALFRLVGNGLRSSRSALASSQEIFRGAFQEAPSGVAVLARDHFVLRANDEIVRLARMGGHDEVPADMSLLFQKADRSAFKSSLSAVLSGAESRMLDLRSAALDRTGEPLVLKVSLSPLMRTGGEAAAVATVEDVTERVRDQRRLEELVRSKDEFVASVSHELRTPLTAVVGFAEVLSQEWGHMPEKEAAKLIEDVARESREVASIVEDLLVIARADIGTVTLLPEMIDCEYEVRRILNGLAAENMGRIQVKVEPTTAWADPIRFRQVVRNLLTNAVRYGGDDVRLYVTPVVDAVEFVVADNGNGVDGETERIFEPYVRAHENPTQPASVGLGLAVSRSLARAMGGDLAYSRTGGWTRFTFTIPSPPVRLVAAS